MRSVALALLLSLSTLGFSSSTSPNPVTVVLEFEQSTHTLPLLDIQRELQKVLSVASITVDVRLRDEVSPDGQPGQLVVFKMKGSCSMQPVLPIGALSDERGPLAMTYTTEGQILPFGEVECDRIRESLSRIYGPGLGGARSSALGTALARVIAHEIYHMLAQSKNHAKSGDTKASLSAYDLTKDDLRISDDAQAALSSTAPCVPRR